MKIKRIIVLALVAIMLFAMTACDNIANKPQKDFGEYPELPKGDGYTITGKCHSHGLSSRVLPLMISLSPSYSSYT